MRAAEEANPGSDSRWVLPAILLAAAAARLWGLGADGFWADEIRTARLAALPAGRLLQSVFVDGSFAVPVLGILATRAVSFLGTDDAVLRLPSVLFGLAGIAVTARLAARAYGRREGWVAAALLTLHHAHLYYSREARPYALLALFVALLSLASLRVERGGLRRWAALGLLAGLSLHAHFLAVLPAAACVGVAAALRVGRRGEGWRLGLAGAGVALLALPLVLSGRVFDLVSEGGSSPLLLAASASGRVAAFLGPGWTAGAWFAGGVALLGVLGSWRGSRAWVSTGIAQVVLAVVVFALLPIEHGWAPRYLFFLLPVVVVFQARGLTCLAARVPVASGAVVVLLAAGFGALNAPGWSAAYAPHRRDWRGAAQAVVERIPRGALVLSCGVPARRPTRDLSPECLAYYLGDRDGFSMPDDHRILTASRTGGPGLDLREWTRGRSVCAALLHSRRTTIGSFGELPADVEVVQLRGLTLLFPGQEGWRATEDTALLLVAAGGVARHPPESGRLLERGAELALEATDPAVRRTLGRTLEAALERRYLGYPVGELGRLQRFDRLVEAIGRLDPSGEGDAEAPRHRLRVFLSWRWRDAALRARRRGAYAAELGALVRGAARSAPLSPADTRALVRTGVCFGTARAADSAPRFLGLLARACAAR